METDEHVMNKTANGLSLMRLRVYKNQLLGLLVALVAFIVYADSLQNGFVGDDYSVIVNNPVLQGSPLALFSTIDTTNDTEPMPYYRPLTYLTFLIEQRLDGLAPFWVRLFNVLLHAANAFLVYRLAGTFFKDIRISLLAGLLFAVHPLASEAVDFNAGGRNTMLACFFLLTAYLLHARSAARERFSGALAGAVAFSAGLFSKEVALGILPFLGILEFEALRSNNPRIRLRAFGRLLPYLAGASCYLVMRWSALSRFGIQTSIIPGIGTPTLDTMLIVPGIGARLLNDLYIIPRYLATVLWPTSLSPIYVVPDDLHLLALPLLAGWLCIIGFFGWYFSRGRSRTTLFGLSWLAIFWLPVSGVIYFPSAPLADRFLYVPAIGLWIIAADQFVRLTSSDKHLRKYASVLVVIALLALSALTIERNLDWQSEITLYTKVVEQYPDNPYGHAFLGHAYCRKHGVDYSDLTVAEKEFEEALAMQPVVQDHGRAAPPDYALMIQVDMGHIGLEQGNYQSALRHYSEALALYPLEKEARISRAIVLEKLGRYREALTDYRLFLAMPGFNNQGGWRDYAEERVRQLSRS